jgi:hypothetical protein
MNKRTRKMPPNKRAPLSKKRSNGRISSTILSKPPRSNLWSALTPLVKIGSFRTRRDSSLLKLLKCSKRLGRR